MEDRQARRIFKKIALAVFLIPFFAFPAVLSAQARDLDYFNIKKTPEQRAEEAYAVFKKDSALNESLSKWEDLSGSRAKARALYNIGNMLFEERLYRQAAEHYKKAVEFNPEEKDAYYNLGVIYDCYLRDNRKAVENFSKYVEIAPEADDAPYVRNRISQIRIRSKAGIYRSARTIATDGQ